MMPTSGNAHVTPAEDGTEVLVMPILAYLAIGAGAIMLILGSLHLIGTGGKAVVEGVPNWVLGAGLFLLGLVALILGVIQLRAKRAAALKFTSEGLYVRQHKLTVPWDAIDTCELVDLQNRKSGGEKLAGYAVQAALGPQARMNKPILQIVISFTQAGHRHFQGKDLIGKSFRKALKVHDTESLLIRPAGLDMHSRQAPFRKLEDLAAAIQRRSDAHRGR